MSSAGAAVLVALLSLPGPLPAQATYKLEVKPDLRPAATLTLEGNQVRRSALKNDPGFRLQYTITKGGKPLKSLPARGTDRVDLPDLSPGTYSVVLELFYPAYKSGTVQKGEFRPASNALVYEIKPPPKAGAPVQVALLGNRPLADRPRALGKPALVIQCGKGRGEQEKEVLAPGYDYQLVRGTRYDGWKPPAGKSHCWTDAEEVHVILKVPPGAAGVLRLHAVDGDGTNLLFRTQKVLVEGKEVASEAVFHGPGVFELVDVAAPDTRDGKVDVVFRNTRAGLTAVVSTIEFFPAEKR